jgi:spermidine synthase
VATALILSGFAAMGTEMLWFRFLTSALGQYRLVFSLLLAVVLVGIWLGSMAGGLASDRLGAPALWFAGTQIAMALSTLASLWLFDLGLIQSLVREQLGASPLGIGLLAEIGIHLTAIVEVVGLPSFFMGAAYPLANAMVQDREGSVGRRAGWLYLANALGSVSGSTATGFLLLPALGQKWSLFALMIAALGSLLPVGIAARKKIFLTHEHRRPALALACGLGLVIALLAGWSRTPADGLVLKSFRAAARPAVRDALRPPYLVATSEGPLESIVILDVAGQGRTLYTNGHPMSSTAPGEQRYMRAFVHLPLLHDDAPESVLVICFGVGNTAHAASLHGTLRRIEVVDISRHVLEQADYFSATNGRVLRDPRVSVFVNDGRHHLTMQPEGRYDLITLEPPPINFSGVASLYSEEFYALARSRLRPGGFLSQWLPVPQVPPETARSMIRAFIEVFPGSLLLNGDAGNFILVGRKDLPIELDPASLARRLAAEPLVRDDLDRIQMASPTEIFGAFAADARHLLEATARTGPLTDDLPLIEYGRIYRPRTGIPGDLFDVTRVSVWCPRCFAETGPAEEVADLRTYLGIMSTSYSRSHSAAGDPGAARLPPAWRAALDPASVARTFEASPYLRRLRGDR